MFADYKSLIVAAYQEKTASNDLPLRLVQPTPGNLKKECLAIFEERYLKKDEKALREFFGPLGEKSSRMETIDRCVIDKFRPLVKFLKDPTGSPEEKNIELLAWLIDFEPRPFELGRRYKHKNADLPENISADIQNKANSNNDEKQIKPDQITKLTDPALIESGEVSNEGAHPRPALTSSKPQKSVVLLILLPLALLGTGIYWWTATKKATTSNTPGTHQKSANATVLALDSGKANHKITDWDTITQESIGKVGYFKLQGELELYTSPGVYPPDQRFRLLPLSRHIYTKYVVPKQHHLVAASN